MKRNEGIHRHDISDEAWERIKKLLPGQAGKRGKLLLKNWLCADGFFQRVLCRIFGGGSAFAAICGVLYVGFSCLIDSRHIKGWLKVIKP